MICLFITYFYEFLHAMAADELQPPEGFDKGPSGGSDDVETIELSPGETIQGTLVQARDGEGEYGPYALLRVSDEERGLIDFFAKGEAKRMYFADDLAVGDELWIGMSTETDTYDGNEYNPVLCRKA